MQPQFSGLYMDINIHFVKCSIFVYFICVCMYTCTGIHVDMYSPYYGCTAYIYNYDTILFFNHATKTYCYMYTMCHLKSLNCNDISRSNYVRLLINYVEMIILNHSTHTYCYMDTSCHVRLFVLLIAVIFIYNLAICHIILFFVIFILSAVLRSNDVPFNNI